MKSRLLPVTGGQVSVFKEFGSTRLCQFVLRTVICGDGRGDAWKSRASRSTHQDFLIGAPAASSGRRMAAMAPKSDRQNQELDVPVHKVLPKNVFIPSAGKLHTCQIQITL